MPEKPIPIALGDAAALPLVVVCIYCTAIDTVAQAIPDSGARELGDIRLPAGWTWATTNLRGLGPDSVTPACPDCVRLYAAHPERFVARQIAAKDANVIDGRTDQPYQGGQVPSPRDKPTG